MTEPKARYTLACSDNPWSDVFMHSDDLQQLKVLALDRLKNGARCFIIDHETGEQMNLKLKGDTE